MKVQSKGFSIFSAPNQIPGELKRQHIIVDRRCIRKTKQFIRELVNLGITSGNISFSKLDPYAPNLSIGEMLRRRPDEGMDLEKFLSKLTSKSRAAIQFGGSSGEEIRFYTEYDDYEDERKLTRFLFYECIFNPINNRSIKEIFQKVYGVQI